MFTELELTNFKCFQEETITLNNLTLLTGLNGMGKSSVIQAFLFLKQNIDLGHIKNASQMTLNGNLVELGLARDILHQYFDKKMVQINLKKGMASFSTSLIITDLEATTLKHETKITEETCFEKLKEPLRYLNTERMGPRPYYHSHHYGSQGTAFGLHGELIPYFLAKNHGESTTISALKHPKATGSSLGEQVNHWLSEIRPGAKINATAMNNLDIVKLSYQFKAARDVSNEFRPTNVGFGLTYVLGIIVALLSSKPGDLILLENPETHLHPKGQTIIGRMLALAAANDVQIIVETHSDHILNGIRIAVLESLIAPEKVSLQYFTGKEIKGRFSHYIEKPQIHKDGTIDYWPIGFFDEFEIQLKKLLSAR